MNYNELLKQRELPDGYYYCRTRSGEVEVYCIVANYLPREFFSEIVGKVPEWTDVVEDEGLTEKFQSGELPCGFYYFYNGAESYPVWHRQIGKMKGCEGVQVLCEIPSYEEFMRLLSLQKE